MFKDDELHETRYCENCLKLQQELQEAMDNYVNLDLSRVKEYNELVDKYKAKEQECEELKSDLTDLSKIIDCKNGTILIFKEQLDQLKADNEELKRQHESDKGLITSTGKMNYQLIQEYDKLKAENEELKKTIMYKCPQCGDEYLSPIGASLYEENNNLKQILTGIKEIAEPFCNACQEFEPEKKGRDCMYCNYGKILQKISECEVGK